MIQDIINDIAIAQEQVYCKSRCEDEINWLKSLKDRVQPQPKQEWSEKDEKEIEHLIDFLNHPDFIKAIPTIVNNTIAWLKSLRPQNVCTYNPYKTTIESISEMVEKYANGGDLQDFYDNVKVKCKEAKEYDTLFPQNHWKPSEEQMEALEHFIVYHNGSTNYAKDLEELRLQLKKLMEE